MTTRYIYPDGEKTLWELLESADQVAVDTETNGLRPYHGDRVWGISLYFPKADVSYYIPVRYLEGGNISEHQYKRLAESVAKVPTLIMFNAKFDMHMLEQDGFTFPNPVEDVLIAAHLLNENEYVSNGGQVAGAYKLKRLAKKYLGESAVEGEKELEANAKKRGLNPKTEMWKMPAVEVAFYAMKDTEITWALRELYRDGLQRWGQWGLYQTKNRIQQLVIMRMERNGMRIDIERVKQHIADIGPQVEQLQAEFDAWLAEKGLRFTPEFESRRINLNSPIQVKAMFSAFGYELENTDQYTMRDLQAAGVELAERLVTYRQQSKAASTYYEPYLRFVTENEIIHHSISLVGTVTRRMSSMEPNFQNIPRKNGKLLVKQVFITRPGYVLLQADYKALELRIGVHFSGEKTMRDMIMSGGDLHQYTADQLQVTRDRGKTFNFGLSYGMGWKKAARVYGMKPKEAKRAIEGWHKLYPAFRRALGHWEQVARQWRTVDGKPNGKFQFVRLENGVVRHYNEYAAHPAYDGEYRGAWNFVVQGTAAIVTETSALRIAEYFPDDDTVKIVNAVHDSLMFEVRRDKVNEVVPVIKRLMEDWPQFQPNLEVDIEISDTSWYDMRKYKAEEWENVA